jgi:polysaccharide pyruvyl transferase WcaK-like protein
MKSKSYISRRSFMQRAASMAPVAVFPFGNSLEQVLTRLSGQKKNPTILLRSSWQTENIGDIGHTPGALRLLDQYIPQANLILWPGSVDNGVDTLLRQYFPKLQIAEGTIDESGQASTPALKEAIARADLLMHGSGPSVVAENHMQAWRKLTSKPYGIYGVTIGEVSPALQDLLSNAAFVYCRDTDSLRHLQAAGVKPPVLEFAPDATFAIHLRNEEKAKVYLKANGLEERQFMCAVPRLRYTPYHQFKQVNWTEEKIRQVEGVNAETKEKDHAKLREAIVAWVRQTGKKVLVCPEMTYQLDIIPELLVDPLPEDVKKRVVRRETYWLPDEAGSIYARAHTIVSFEMHSPIIAAAMGTPAIHLRQPTDTRKGQMWRDIGLGDWLFEIEQTRGEDIARTLLNIHHDYPAAREKLRQAMAFAGQRQQESMNVVKRTVSLPARAK